MSKWDPDTYLRFEQERTLPSRDLAAKVELADPKNIVDIGCGPGNSTNVLRLAWPKAKVAGLDNSEEMISKAAASYPGNEWILADAANWRPIEKYDLVFSNATLQWIPEHERLLPQLFSLLNENGVLAVQVPFNVESPLYKAIVKVSNSQKWRKLMTGCSDQILYRDAAHYYNILVGLTRRFELWMTTYLHVMDSHRSLIEWYSSTGLKMYLERIENEKERDFFKLQILDECKLEYPPQKDGKTLFPFQRLFFIAHRASET